MSRGTGNVMKGAASGLVAGLVASWVMNQFQETLSLVMEGREKPHGAQSLQEGLPDHGAGAMLQERGVDDGSDDAAERTANFISVEVFERKLSKDEKNVGGAIAHYLFGATTGALYGAGAELFPGVGVGAGLPFGAVVWVVADEIVTPGLGLSKAASSYSFSKHAYAFSSHLVYGLTTDLVLTFLRGKRKNTRH
jgi:putative membrane protein